jgi:NitT/TauT family transport system ATP-binding protein
MFWALPVRGQRRRTVRALLGYDADGKLARSIGPHRMDGLTPALHTTSVAATRGQPLIRIAGVGKRYTNGTHALQDIDLTVAEGEFLSLLGPSGCGKSTLLRLIAGLGEPSEGSIDWPRATHDAAGRPQRSIGFVFQEPTLMPWATVFDNVYLPLRLAGRRRRDVADDVAAAIEGVGLAAFAKAYPRQLSGGMRMRVSIARALVTRPKVLLMDEPFAALDEITRMRLNDDLLELWRGRGWTVLFVTHSVYESVYLSTRIAVMGARPGHLREMIDITEPYPRGEAFRTSLRYNESCRTTSAALHDAMANVSGIH